MEVAFDSGFDSGWGWYERLIGVALVGMECVLVWPFFGRMFQLSEFIIFHAVQSIYQSILTASIFVGPRYELEKTTT